MEYEIGEEVIIERAHKYIFGIVKEIEDDTYRVEYRTSGKKREGTLTSDKMWKATPQNRAIVENEQNPNCKRYYDEDIIENMNVDLTGGTIIPFEMVSLLIADWSKCHNYRYSLSLPCSITVSDVIHQYQSSIKATVNKEVYTLRWEIIQGVLQTFRIKLEEDILYPREIKVWSNYLKNHSNCDCILIFGVQHLIRLLYQLITLYATKYANKNKPTICNGLKDIFRFILAHHDMVESVRKW